MEQTISQLQLIGLQIKLTSEKLYIQTNVSQEAIALRSINGIGVIDQVEEYNKELTEYNTKKRVANQGIVLITVGIALGLFLALSVNFYLIFFGLIIAAPGVGLYIGSKNILEPSLKSSVRIMITGTYRDFTFDKANSNASDIANFVAQVENTLSAFHKN